ncbi:MAG: nucleoside deaminase [Clostridia bacterium]
MITEFLPKNEFMLECLRLAHLALEQGEVPVGAIVELDGKIIGFGHNQTEKLQDPTAHAEVLAIKMACKNLGNWRLCGANLYVSMEPCVMCTGTIINSRIKRVIFGAHDRIGGALGSAVDLTKMNKSKKILIYRGFMEAECASLLRGFFKNLR